MYDFTHRFEGKWLIFVQYNRRFYYHNPKHESYNWQHQCGNSKNCCLQFLKAFLSSPVQTDLCHPVVPRKVSQRSGRLSAGKTGIQYLNLIQWHRNLKGMGWWCSRFSGNRKGCLKSHLCAIMLKGKCVSKMSFNSNIVVLQSCLGPHITFYRLK